MGDILMGIWSPNAPGRPILLLCHMDTVWPVGTLPDQVPIRQDEDRFYGPGALDMKAGIVIAIEAIRALQVLGQMPQRPIYMMVTTDEETGSHHSRQIILETAAECALTLVMEPAAQDNEGLKTWRKGIGNYTITARGKASHAGAAPEEGVNAVVELAHQTIALHSLNALRQALQSA
ncbi:MAG: M20 family metallopeptidase [Anaerolineae bacterium]|nr:M20 family metallopeptidase [Anaerolineae bacterium]